MTKGKFISLEGIDGAGTTTHAQKLLDYLVSRKIDAVLTSEPTDGPIGRLIRKILSGKEVQPLPQEFDAVMAMLFTADRRMHACSIKAAIDDGCWVITDRYALSTYVYQGRGINPSIIKSMHADLAIHPDMTLILDAPVRVCVERIKQRGKDLDVFEHIEFLQAAQEKYLLMGALDPNNYMVRSDGSIEETFGFILRHVEPLTFKE